MRTSDPGHVEVIKAFLAAREKIASEVIVKDAKNPHHGNRYATLGNIRSVVDPILAANGLYMSFDFTRPDPGALLCVLRLIHVSGEWLENDFPIELGKTYMRVGTKKESQQFELVYDPQQSTTAATYAMRYNIVGLFGLIIEDDDGERASGRRASKKDSGGNGDAEAPSDDDFDNLDLE